MAVFTFKMEVLEDGRTRSLAVKVKARSNLDKRTIAIKALNKVVPILYADSLDVMDSIKSLRKESFEWEDFAESIEQDLGIKISTPTNNK